MPESHVKTIFLPSSSHTRINPSYNVASSVITSKKITSLVSLSQKLKQPETSRKLIIEKMKHINLTEILKRNKEGKLLIQDNSTKTVYNISKRPPSLLIKKYRRRNDKFLQRRKTNPEDYDLFMSVRDKERTKGIDYIDCMTAGWGKFSSSGSLSDVLLKINVPIHNIKR